MAKKSVFSVKILSACNLDCSFCPDDRRSAYFAKTEDVVAEIRAAAATGKYSTFSALGGEPTLHPDLDKMIAAAKTAGFSEISIVTNGVLLADAAYARKLRDAGLTNAGVSVHYSDVAKHPHVRKQLAALRNLIAAGVPVVNALTVLHAGNLDRAETLAALLAKVGVRHVGFAFCSTSDAWERTGDLAAFPAEFPDPALAVKKALALCRLSEKLGMKPSLHGFPLCLLPESAWPKTDAWHGDFTTAHRVYRDRETVVSTSWGWDRKDGADPCRKCRFLRDGSCRGIHGAYLKCYPATRLAPAEDAAPGAPENGRNSDSPYAAA